MELSDVLYFSDIDECETSELAYKHNCHVNASCANTHGSFICTCVSVYTGDGVSCIGIILLFNAFLLFFFPVDPRHIVDCRQ